MRIEAPEGATQEQVLAFAQQNYQSAGNGIGAQSMAQSNVSSAGRVQGPDGQLYEFPDGTPRETMRAAMAKRYGEPQQRKSRLQKIEQALRAADAAGNTDDARRLAQAYAAERDSHSQAQEQQREEWGTAPRVDKVPLLLEAERRGILPSDKKALLDEARRRGLVGNGAGLANHNAPTYTVDQLFAKLERADAAGDTEAAKVIADEIRRVQGQLSRADFSNVQGQARTMGDRYEAAGIDPAPHDPGQDGGRLSIGPFDTGIRTPPWLDRELSSFGRGTMIGARATMEGVASIPDLFFEPVRRGVEQLTGTPQLTYQQMAARAADATGLPSAATSGERVVSDVGRALSATGATLGIGGLLPAGNKLGALLTSQPRLQALSAATGAAAGGAARENGGGQGSQFIASLVGGLGPGSVRSAGESALMRLLRGGEKGRQRVSQAIEDFASVGAVPSVGQAAGNWRTQGLESLLAGGPTSGSTMGRFAEQQARQTGEGLGKRADQFFPNASAERAGRAIERGADTFAGNVKATRSALYWQADQLIPANTKLPLTRTWQTLDALVSPTPGATATTGALVNPKIAQMAENVAQDLAANGGSMPYEAVRVLRSRIGEELTDFTLSADRPTAQYKRLYAALSQDLEDAARQQGPAAEQAYKRANAYTRASADRLEQVQRVVDKNGGPEKVYAAVMSGTQDGGTTLRAVMQSLPSEGQKAVTAAVIKRMGLATPGNQGAAGEAFSAGTFLTNWNRISPEARRTLFDRYGKGFSADMDKMASVAERIRTGSRVFANPSGTANKIAGYTYWAGLGGAALASPYAGPMPFLGLALTGVSGAVLARAMTNPNLVAFMARNAEKPVGSVLGTLAVLAQSDPDAAALYQEVKSRTTTPR